MTNLDTGARSDGRVIRVVFMVAAVFLLASLAVYDVVTAWMLNRRELALPLVLGILGLLVLGVALFAGLAAAGVH